MKTLIFILACTGCAFLMIKAGVTNPILVFVLYVGCALTYAITKWALD